MAKRDWWYCNVCHAQNSVIDGECQFCECQGAVCELDNCSDPGHFICRDPEHEHISEQDAKACGCAHEWDYGETEDAPILCVRCGADGLN